MPKSARALISLLLSLHFGTTAPLHAQPPKNLGLKFPHIPGLFSGGARETAAEPRRHFERIEFEGDLETLLRDRLQRTHDIEALKKFLDQLRLDPNQFSLDPAKVQELGLQDPKLQQILKQWQGAAGPEGLSEEQLLRLKKIAGAWSRSGVEPGVPLVLPPPAPAPGPVSSVPPPPEDGLKQITDRFVRHLETADLELLRKSPGVQRAVERMKSTLDQAPAGSGEAAERWLKRVVPKDLPWQAGERVLERLQNLNLPEGWQFSWPAMGPVPAPHLPAGGLPGLPQVSLGKFSLWLLILALSILAGWRALAWAARKQVTSDEAAPASPFDLPETVATRTELIQAFDRLALLHLGPVAKSWNHRAVARHWAMQAAASVEAVHGLADLYEFARYTAGPEALALEQVAQAQRDLRALRQRFLA